MKIKKAHMEVIDRFGRPVTGEDTVSLDGGKEGIDLSIRRGNDGHLEAEIRYEPKDADLAADLGNDSDYVLLDWFMVHDVEVTYRSGRMILVGYMAGAKGFRRDGESPYGEGRGVAYTDDGGPLVRVEWVLA